MSWYLQESKCIALCFIHLNLCIENRLLKSYLFSIDFDFDFDKDVYYDNVNNYYNTYK